MAVKLADLGDALLITPALAALREAFPQAQIDVLTTNGRPVLENQPGINRVIIFNKYLFDEPRTALKPRNLGQALQFFGSLFLARYDTVIFFHHFTLRFGVLKFAALALATGAKRRVGLDNGRAWFLNHKLPDKGWGTLSERDYWLELVHSLGAARPKEDRPHLILTDQDHASAQALLNEVCRETAAFKQARESDLPVANPIIAINAGGGHYSLARRWLPISFAQVADKLVEDYNARIVLVGVKDEIEISQQIQSLMKHPEAAIVLAGRTNVGEISAFLQRCQLFIGNDGGTMQLASAVGTPTVAIFGPTNHQAWGPYGWQTAADFAQNEPKPKQGGAIVVQANLDLPCRPCLYRDMELGKRLGCAPRPCLTELSPDQVIEAATLLLK